MSDARIRVAIIGTGMIAAVHRRSAMLAGADLVGVLGSSPARSRQAAIDWGVASAFGDIDELAGSNVDVVHVCTPNSTHAAYVEVLLAAGKHVVCEKPLATTLDDATRLAEASEAAGLVATVPFVYRYHPMAREIRSRVQSGELGHVNLLHGHYLQDWLLSPDASNWRVDPQRGGQSRAFADIGSHWCDLVEWISGERLDAVVASLVTAVPQRSAAHLETFVRAEGGALTEVRTEDIATMLFRTMNGVPGSLTVSQVAAGRKNRLWFEIDCAAGSAAFDQEQPESIWLGTADGHRTVVRDPHAGSSEQRRLSYLPAGHSQGYADCFAAFVADTYCAVRGGKPEGLPSFADGARAAQIIDAVLRSSRELSWTSIAA